MPSNLTTVAPKHKGPPDLLLVMSLPLLKDLEFCWIKAQQRWRVKSPKIPSKFPPKLPFLETCFELFVLPTTFSQSMESFCKSAHSRFPDHIAAEVRGSFFSFYHQEDRCGFGTPLPSASLKNIIKFSISYY